MIGLLVELPDMTSEQAAEVLRKLNPGGKPPAGQVLHVEGPMEGGGTRVVDVWESMDAFEAFMTNQLGPIMGPMGIAAPKPLVWPITTVLK